MAGALSCSPLVPPSFSSLATRASIVSILVLTEASCSWCPLHSTLISAIWSLDSARCACIVASSRPTMSLSWPTAICSSPRKRSRRASMVNAGWSPLPLFCGLVSRLRRSEGAAVEAAGESPPSVAIATGMLINGLAPRWCRHLKGKGIIHGVDAQVTITPWLVSEEVAGRGVRA